MSSPLVDVTGVRRERERARRHRQLVLGGIAAAGLALVVGVCWVIFASPWLRVAQVEVSGTSLTTPDQVVAAAGVPVGDPMVGVDADGASRRVREALPAVERADVGRRLPGTVTIAVTERVPAFVVPDAGGLAWVAADGVAFHSSAEAPKGVPTARVRADDHELLTSLGTIAAHLPAPVRDQARTIEAPTRDSVVITLADGRRIVWGGASDSELKARVLGPLLNVKAREYDVSSPVHPTTR